VKKEKSCGAVIFRKHQDKYQYVLIKQKFTLEFGFPKGHVETNETEVMTAYREVKEETGLDVEIFTDVRGVVQYNPRPGVVKKVVYFLAAAKSVSLRKQDSEIESIAWVDESDVVDRLRHSSVQKIFQSFIDKKR